MKKAIFMLLMIWLTLSSIPINAKVISTRFISYHGFELCEKTHLTSQGDTIVLYGIYQNGKEIIAAHYDMYDYSSSLNAILLMRKKDITLEISLFDVYSTKIVWKNKFLNATIKGFKDITENKATLNIIGPRRIAKEWQKYYFIRDDTKLYLKTPKRNLDAI